MRVRRTLRALGRAGCLIALLSAPYAERAIVNAAEQTAPLRYLDRGAPSIAEPIAAAAPTRRFVRVEVADVVNPGKLALTFRLYYVPSADTKTYLGSFSLYPADNPGTFLVATQGKVGGVGAIVLSLTMTDGADLDQTIRVAIKTITLVDG